MDPDVAPGRCAVGRLTVFGEIARLVFGLADIGDNDRRGRVSLAPLDRPPTDVGVSIRARA